MNNQYNIWCKWHPLKTVVLGDCYKAEYFSKLKNNRIKNALSRIADETQEDLENFEKVLKDFGCTVIRPTIDNNKRITDIIHPERIWKGPQGIPRPPLQPRDSQIVIGKKLYISDYDADYGFIPMLESYNKKDIIDWTYVPDKFNYKRNDETTYDELKGSDWPTFKEYFETDFWNNVPKHIAEEIKLFSQRKFNNIPCASITLIGKDLYVDLHDGEFLNHQVESIKEYCDLRIHFLNIGGHNDSCFHVLKPGAILSLKKIQTYSKTFPNWDICYLPNQSWDLVQPFLDFKTKVDGKWWVPGEEHNDEFTYFVETWLNKWVGYCEETVFDVNVLMLDDRTVCVNNYNETVFNFLKKHKIEPIIVPWRHRYFWDGGLHCITLDLYREGEMEDYFPDRRDGIIDPGF